MQPTPTYDQVVIALATDILLPHYSLYYPSSPVDSFQPSYKALADGSLVLPPLRADVKALALMAFLIGLMLSLFVRNTLVSADYVFRGSIKHKYLLYTLLASQIIGLVGLTTFLAPLFMSRLNCTTSFRIGSAFCSLSVALLISGIYGVKAYRCLENSRLVMAILVLLRTVSTAFTVLQLAFMTSGRSLAGACSTVGNPLYVRIYVILMFAESCFICVCFLYAVHKSRGARGRISIRPSEPSLHSQIREQPSTRRGWWDYAPQSENENEAPRAQPATRIFDTLSNIPDLFRNKKMATRKPFVPGDFPISQHNRTSQASSDAFLNASPRSLGRQSYAPSTLSRLMPRMLLFTEVMRDELVYTAFITATCVAVALMSIVGSNIKNSFDVFTWLSLNWAVISILAIHSFGRVARRHECEADLQHPRNMRFSNIRPPPSSTSFRTSRSQGSDILANPFEESHEVSEVQRSVSWTSSASGTPRPTMHIDSGFTFSSPISEKFPRTQSFESDIGLHPEL